jgi:hypothetical protein
LLVKTARKFEKVLARIKRDFEYSRSFHEQ